MRRAKIAALIVPLLSAAFGGGAAAQVPTLPSDGGSRLDGPSCTTLDAGRRPATNFRAGDEFILRGTKYPPNVLVLVTFRQAPHSVELARFKTSNAGDFTSEPTILRVPADASSGRASVRVASSGGSASCDLTLTGTAGSTAAKRSAKEPISDQLNPWLIVWATLLALGGGYLAFVRYRRYQADALERSLSGARAADVSDDRPLRLDPHRPHQ